MRTLFLLPLLALFAVPLASDQDRASHWFPSLSGSQEQIVARADNTRAEPSRVSTTTKQTTSKPTQKPAVKKEVAAVAVATLATSNAVPTPSPAPHPQPAPTPVPSPSTTQPTSQNPQADFAAHIEAEVLRLTNEERIKNGLSPLARDGTLRDVAWGHSADMIANNYFAHENQAGCSSSCRATNAGYTWRTIGENIYMMSGYKLSAEKTAAMVVNGWMNSAGHRKNILGESFTVTGVGTVYDGKSVYVTALYAKPR